MVTFFSSVGPGQASALLLLDLLIKGAGCRETNDSARMCYVEDHRDNCLFPVDFKSKDILSYEQKYTCGKASGSDSVLAEFNCGSRRSFGL